MAASFETWFCETYKNQRLTGPLAIHMRAAWNAAEQKWWVDHQLKPPCKCQKKIIEQIQINRGWICCPWCGRQLNKSA